MDGSQVSHQSRSERMFCGDPRQPARGSGPEARRRAPVEPGSAPRVSAPGAAGCPPARSQPSPGFPGRGPARPVTHQIRWQDGVIVCQDPPRVVCVSFVNYSAPGPIRNVDSEQTYGKFARARMRDASARMDALRTRIPAVRIVR